MPITATIPRVSYTATAGQTLFPYTWMITSASELRVYVNGALMTLSVQYNVTGVGAGGGGNVVAFSPPATGASVVILGQMAIDQGLDLTDHDPFPAQSVESALDKSARIDQQLQEQLNRSVKLAPTSLLGPITLPEPTSITTSAGGKKALVYNDTGTNLSLVELVMQTGLVGDQIPIVTQATLGPAGNQGKIRYVSDLNTLAVDQAGVWHLFTSIDEMVVPQTTRASLPPASTIAGRARYLSDAPKALAISDGTVWREIPIDGIGLVASSPVGSLPTASPAGQLIRRTDSFRGLLVSDGSLWQGINSPTYRPGNYAGADFGARLNACIADMPAEGGTVDARGIVGAQTATATITINKPIKLLLGEVTLTSSASPLFNVTATLPVVIEGISRNQTILRATSATQTILALNTSYPVRLAHLTLDSSLPKTAGAGVHVLGAGGLSNGLSRFYDLNIVDQFVGIDFVNAASWVLCDSYIVNSVQTGVSIQNTLFPDAGDSTIYGCTFDSVHTGVNVSAILQRSSGGLRLINNKILSHYYGYVLDIGATTVILLIEGNSIENQTGPCIGLGRSGGTATFSAVIITGNQLTNTVTGCIACSSDAISNVIISNNVMGFLSPNTGVAMIGVNGAMIHGNILNGSGGSSVGVNVAAGAFGVDVGPNGYSGIPLPVQYTNATFPTTTNVLPGFTTTQRNALTNVRDGTMILNTTTGVAQVKYTSGWRDILTNVGTS